MSSKKALKQAQKQAYAKHRSSITNSSKFNFKNKNSIKKNKKKNYLSFSNLSIFLHEDMKEIPSSLFITVFIMIFGLSISNNNCV